MTSQDDGTDAVDTDADTHAAGDDLHSADLPSLSADDETYVRELLASLPAIPIPDDLAARLDEALRDAASAPDDSAALGTTVVPLDAARRGQGRRTRVLQIAAVSLLVVAGGLTVVRFAGSNSSGSTSTAAGAAAPSTAVDSSFVTRSGHAYSDATLVSDVRSLAAHRTLSPDAGQTTALPQPQSTGSESGNTAGFGVNGSPSSDSTRSAETTDAKGALTSRSGLVACLAAVEDGLSEPVTPLAVDQGSYRGQAALVVVLPGSQDPTTTYDVFVVGILCGQNADAHLLTYQLVEAR